MNTARATGRHFVKVTFDNGDTIRTEINGTKQEIENYYRPENVFNLGAGEYDRLTGVRSLEFLS